MPNTDGQPPISSSSLEPSRGQPLPSPQEHPSGAVSVVGGLVATSAILAVGWNIPPVIHGVLDGKPDAFKVFLVLCGLLGLIAAPTSARDILAMARRVLGGDR